MTRYDMAAVNAGVVEPITHLADADPEAWSQAIDVNLKGAFLVGQPVAREMLTAAGPSLWEFNGTPGRA